ncbi:MAG: hypothetical protein Q8865_10115 [Bacillota bacterium]|nr:hypothetical protein [Bacillota bacterium]
MSIIKKLKMSLLPPSSNSFHAAVTEQRIKAEELNALITDEQRAVTELKQQVLQQINEMLDQNKNLLTKVDEINLLCGSRNLLESIEQFVTVSILHQKSFAGYKNKYSGHTVVLCGAGESLSYYEPIEGAIHIAVNRAFLLNKVKFDYIFSQDFRGISHIQQELKEYEGNNCVKFFGYQNGNISEIPESFAMECNAVRFYTDIGIGVDNDFARNITNSKFAVDILTTPLGNFWSSIFPPLQFILYTHPSKIYIVGCDCIGGHFDNRKQTDQEIEQHKEEILINWSTNGKINPQLLQHWQGLKDFANRYYPDTEIVSINPLGLKGLFVDEYTDNFIRGQNSSPL